MTEWVRYIGSRRGTAHIFDIHKAGLGRVRAVSLCGNVKLECSPRDLEPIDDQRCPTCLSLLKEEAEPNDPLAGYQYEDITKAEVAALGLVVGDNSWRSA